MGDDASTGASADPVELPPAMAIPNRRIGLDGSDWFGFWAATALTLVVYLYTLAPDVTLGFLFRNSVIFEKLRGTQKLHRFTLDDDEVNPFHSIFEQFRPTRDLLVIRRRLCNGAVEGFQGLKGIDHFSACCEIGRGCLLLDFNRQRIICVI